MVFRKLKIILDMIKFEHTIFMLPFAIMSAFIASEGMPALDKIGWILVAMVGARSCAMAFNRLVDAEFDKANPRTAIRANPSRNAGEKRGLGVYTCCRRCAGPCRIQTQSPRLRTLARRTGCNHGILLYETFHEFHPLLARPIALNCTDWRVDCNQGSVRLASSATRFGRSALDSGIRHYLRMSRFRPLTVNTDSTQSPHGWVFEARCGYRRCYMSLWWSSLSQWCL